MTELPKKITDDPYGAAVLIRRLVAEQGLAYWRRYLLAFALMAVAAATTAGAAYLLGEVINKAYVDKDVHAIAQTVADHHPDLRAEGRGDLRTYRDPVADRQFDPRQQPAPAIRQADERKYRVLFRTAFVGISDTVEHRRRRGHAGPQSSDQRDRTRSAVADRAGRRDGDDRSLYGTARLRGGAAGHAGAAQAGEAHQRPRAQPVLRHRRHHGNHAGIAAGHSHRQGLYARSGDAPAHRRQHHRGRAQRQQDGTGFQPRQPADGNAGRFCDRGRVDVWRLSRGRDGRLAGPVLFVPDRVSAGLRAGQAPGPAQYRAEQQFDRRPQIAGDRRQPFQRTCRRRQAGAEADRCAGRVSRRDVRLPYGRAGAQPHELRRRARQDDRAGRPLRRRQIHRAGAAAAAL